VADFYHQEQQFFFTKSIDKPKPHVLLVSLMAEDPYNNFLPSTGQINHFFHYSTIRNVFKTTLYTGARVTPMYDPFIGKILTYSVSLLKIDSLFYYKEKPVSASKSGVVKSFIPGYIKKIFFSVQDRVEENDIVLIHEAMKMENEIRAPKSGTVKTLGVHEGDNILANHLLFEIE